jgi:hypothetical protein
MEIEPCMKRRRSSVSVIKVLKNPLTKPENFFKELGPEKEKNNYKRSGGFL